MSSDVGSAETVLAYPGDDPGQVDTLASAIRDGRTQLSMMHFGIDQARAELRTVWFGPDAAAADQEVGNLSTICGRLDVRLDAAALAAAHYRDVLIRIRRSVDLLREEWDRIRAERAATDAEFTATLVWPGAPPDLTNGPGSVADIQQQRHQLQDRLDVLSTRCDELLVEHGRLVAEQQASAATCSAALQTASTDDPDVRSAAGAPGGGGPGGPLGIASLIFDDRIRSSQDIDNTVGEAAWDALSATEQDFYLHLGRAEFTLPLVLGGKDGAGGLWAALHPMARQALIHDEAVMVGNTDGIPVSDRSQANIRSMVGDIERAETALAGSGTSPYELVTKTLTEVDSATLGADFVYPATGMTETEMRAYINAVATRDGMQVAGRTTNAPTFLWIYQPHEWAGEGRVAFSINNPDTADHVVVLAPGVSNNVANRMYADDAVNLARQTQRIDPVGTTAVVNWMGYNAPGGLSDHQALLDDYARAGGKALAADVAALRATDQDAPSNISVFAHSYGSTTTSYALQQGMSRDIDDVAFLGSPGLGTDDAGDAVDSIDDLGMSPGHVWVGMAAFDPISGIVDVHDHNPAVADEFSGAIRFQAETGVGIMGAHSVYYAGHLDSDNHWIASESLYNLGTIAVGDGVGPSHQAPLARTEFLVGPRSSVRHRVDPEVSRNPVPVDMG